MSRIRITDQYSLIKRKGSHRWYLEWREGGQKQRRATGAEDIEAAKERARELILEGATIRNADPAELSVVDVIGRYRAQRGANLASSETVKAAEGIWEAFWGDAAVSDATIDRQEKFVTWLNGRGYSAGYVRRVLGVGKAALNRAWKRGEVTHVPFVELPAEPEPYPHFATKAQLIKLLGATMPEHVRTYVLIRLCTGCRGDAALDLQPFQIDRDAKLIRLNPPGRTQTKKYRPVVPLCDTLLAHLDGLKAESYYVHWHGAKVESIKTTWRKIVVNAKLPAWFMPKVLRHTVATELRRRGVPAWEASGLLGHKRAGTSEIYAKFDPDYLSLARAAIDEWMAELGVNAGSVCKVTKITKARKKA